MLTRTHDGRPGLIYSATVAGALIAGGVALASCADADRYFAYASAAVETAAAVNATVTQTVVASICARPPEYRSDMAKAAVTVGVDPAMIDCDGDGVPDYVPDADGGA